MDTPTPSDSPVNTQEVVTPETNLPPQSTNPNKQSSLLKIVAYGVGALLLVSLGAGGMFAYQQKTVSKAQVTSVQTNNNKLTPTTTPVANEDSNSAIAGWKTYTNPTLGLSFSYPQELSFIYDQFGFNHPDNPEGNLLLQNFDGSLPVTNINSSDFQLVIEVTKNTDNTLLETYVKNPSKVWNINNNQVFTSLLLDNKQALKGTTIQKQEKVPTIWTSHNGFILTFYLATPNSTNVSWFDQILSTFKFSDSNQEGTNTISLEYSIVSTSKTSPDGKYTITESAAGDSQQITLTDNSGRTIVSDLLQQNVEEIGYNVKFRCQCGTSFNGWTDNTHFVIQIVNGGGEEYQYLVNALTGKVDESSFRRTK